VVAVARHASSLTRIMHGHSTSNVMAIAADVEDESQFAAVLARAESRLGHVATIVDARGSLGARAQRPVRPAACASPGRQPSHHR
jgi:NADP-dependent 3-hydroxy acid dehydrogenase YdfG